MTDHIQISAKNLGEIFTEDFCPRCFFIKLKLQHRMPFQIFPGIFSSIDSYTKKCVHALIDAGPEPKSIEGIKDTSYLDSIGKIKQALKAPHWSKFKREYPEYDITLTGAMDDYFLMENGGYVIVDYKTAKYTANADKLMPIYQVQLNGYKAILEASGQKPVTCLFLIYFEPMTEEENARRNSSDAGFSMNFIANVHEVKIDEGMLNEALRLTREYFDRTDIPDSHPNCHNCASVDNIVNIFRTMKGKNSWL